jgi:hypothetical protein
MVGFIDNTPGVASPGKLTISRGCDAEVTVA